MGEKCNSNQWWNNNKCRCEFKKHICEKDYVCNPATCNCENGKYYGWFNDYMWLSYKAILWRYKNYSNKF